MAQLFLGIDIGDDLLSGVVVAGNGKEAKVVSCAFSLLNENTDVAQALPILLEQLRWDSTGLCNVGLSLSSLSLRNLSLPFTDKKKIEQVLPFELEEQLLFLVDEEIISTVHTGNDDTTTKLLTAAVEKSVFSGYLELFKGHGIEPDKVCPAVFVLADQLCKAGSESDNFLLLYCDLGSITMLVVHQGIIVFMRRLSYSTEVFTNSLFSFDGSEVHAADLDVAEKAVSGICREVQRSMDYFSLQCAMNLQPEYVILSGPMQFAPGFREKIKDELDLPEKLSDIAGSGAVSLSADFSDHWLPAVYDCPLALALQAGNRKKDVPFNFCKEEFAPSHQILRFKKQLIGAALVAGLLFLMPIGYFFVDYKNLQEKHGRLSAEMEQIFKKSFPGIDPGRDPLMHMRSKLNEMDTVRVSMPIFSQEKRILVLLADISARIPTAIDLHVTQLIIDRDSVKIKGSTNAFNNVNTIKDVLNKSDQYADVNIVSATKGKEKVGIRFEIKLQLAAGENA
ncbi:MAG: hypothetical protein D3924_11505 [Candidatus Electrothrix sp. AR4]|nr:hypothetical protein [Candidatus Electrothrix sp. AR4]